MESFVDCKPLGSSDINLYFAKIRTTGSGTYGQVYTARVTPEGKASIGTDLPDIVAVKAISTTGLEQTVIDIIKNEVSILKSFSLPHGIKYYGCFQNSSYLYLIMEYIDGRELFDLILDYSLDMDEKIYISKEIAVGIKEFHDAGLVHRDIKPENIMIITEPTLRVVIIDYGFVCNMANPWEGCKRNIGTRAYYDNLVVLGDFESMKKADWWALGQIMSILLVNAVLYDSNSHTYSNLTEKELYMAQIPEILHDILLGLTRTDISQSQRPQEYMIIRALNLALAEAISV